MNSEKFTKTDKGGKLIFGLIRKEKIALRASVYVLFLHCGYYVLSLFIWDNSFFFRSKQ